MRIAAAVFLATALVAALWDLLAGDSAGLRSIGEHWSLIHRESLQLLQPALQRYVHPAAWSDVVFPVLLAPTALVFGGVGVLLGVWAWRRSRAV